MSSFMDPLIVQANDNGTWTLAEKFDYFIGTLNSGQKISIYKGFITDFASVPRIFWAIFPPYGPHYGKAAVLHDALYEAEIFNRKKCDCIFLEAMKILGANIIMRNVIYSSVRCFGRCEWNKHTKESIEKARKVVKYTEK